MANLSHSGRLLISMLLARRTAFTMAGAGQAVDGRTDVRDLDDVHEADGVELLVVFRLDKADGERIRAGRGLVGARADGHAALGVEQDLARGVLKAQLKLLATADIVAVVLFLDRAAVVFPRFRRSVRCGRFSLTGERASHILFFARGHILSRAGATALEGPFFGMGNRILSILHKIKRLNYVEFIQLLYIMSQSCYQRFFQRSNGASPLVFLHIKKARDSLRCPVPFSLFAQKTGR